MTQVLVPIKLPIRLQCLSVPVSWKVVTIRGAGYGPDMPGFQPGERLPAKSSSYDAWEMRRKLFQLEEGDNESAAKFLSDVGLFDKPNLAMQLALLAMKPGSKRELVEEMLRAMRRPPRVKGIDGLHDARPTDAALLPARMFWDFCREVRNEMTAKVSPNLAEWEYQVRFAALIRLGPSAVITTVAFRDAMAASIRIDQLRGARFQICLRCGNPFAAIGPRERKYCEWYCGHVAAVYKKRAEERKKRRLK